MPSSPTTVITTPWVDPIIPLAGNPLYSNSVLPGAGASRTTWLHAIRTAPAETHMVTDPEMLDDPLVASFGINEQGRLAPVYAYDLCTFMRWPALGYEIPLRRHPSCTTGVIDIAVFRYQNCFRTVRTSGSRGVLPHGAKPDPEFWNPAQTANTDNTYIGMEWECEFGSTSARDSTVSAMWLANDRMVNVPWALHNATHPSRRFHVEVDGSLSSCSREIVLMPHAVHQRATYAAFLALWAPLVAKATNSGDRCGMHCHVSRTAVVDNAHAKTIHRLTTEFMGVLTYPTTLLYYTGRRLQSNYARQTTFSTPSGGDRYGYVNWNPRTTVEFRFPGPHAFTDPEWPCYMHDLILAIIEAARRLTARQRDGTLPSQYRAFMEDTGSSVHPRAAQAIFNVVKSNPELYPYAYARFTAPDAPSLSLS